MIFSQSNLNQNGYFVTHFLVLKTVPCGQAQKEARHEDFSPSQRKLVSQEGMLSFWPRVPFAINIWAEDTPAAEEWRFFCWVVFRYKSVQTSTVTPRHNTNRSPCPRCSRAIWSHASSDSTRTPSFRVSECPSGSPQHGITEDLCSQAFSCYNKLITLYQHGPGVSFPCASNIVTDICTRSTVAPCPPAGKNDPH